MDNKLIKIYITSGFKDLGVEIFGEKAVLKELEQGQEYKPNKALLTRLIIEFVSNNIIKISDHKISRLYIFESGKKIKLTKEKINRHILKMKAADNDKRETIEANIINTLIRLGFFYAVGIKYGIEKVKRLYLPFLPGFSLRAFTLAGDITAANMELIRIYKENDLTIREMEEYPLLTPEETLKEHRKSTYQRLAKEHKTYNRLRYKITKETEEYKAHNDIFKLENNYHNDLEILLNNYLKMLTKQKNIILIKSDLRVGKVGIERHKLTVDDIKTEEKEKLFNNRTVRKLMKEKRFNPINGYSYGIDYISDRVQKNMEHIHTTKSLKEFIYLGGYEVYKEALEEAIEIHLIYLSKETEGKTYNTEMTKNLFKNSVEEVKRLKEIYP